MPSPFPSRLFFGFIAALLLCLLGGYLFLADSIPENSFMPHPKQPATAGVPIVPEQDPGNWSEYHDQDFGFSLRYPSDWAPKVLAASDHEVRFAPPESGANPPYALTVKVHKKMKFETVLATVQRETLRGLFPPIGRPTIALGTTEWPIFENYTPDSTTIVSKALIEHDGNVFEFELQRQRDATEIPGMFTLWLRSFGI